MELRSKKEELINRGFINDDIVQDYTDLSFEKKIQLLQSKTPTERTLGARLLSDHNNRDTINLLIDALKKEKKLYSKIEITKTLVSFGLPTVKPLIEQLGKIGINQHTTVPQEKFNKKSYPLPRDIVSRTLAYMGTIALPDLINTLYSTDESQLSEVIDSIGYICFYNHQENIFHELFNCLDRNKSNDLIRWKTVRAMSGLPESRNFLSQLLADEQNEGIKLEIQRSLSLLQRAKT